MKTFKYYINLLFIFSIGVLSAQNNDMKRAIEKGKSDLIAILKQSGEQFNFGMSLEEVEQSEPGNAMAYKEVDFERLLNFDGESVDRLLSKEMKAVVPLMSRQQVVATITVTGNGEVAELINHRYQSDLNKLPREVREERFGNVEIVYVPNLTAIVYKVGDMSYTSYGGNEISRGVSTAELMRKLKSNAVEFQRKYGEELKRGRLLN